MLFPRQNYMHRHTLRALTVLLTLALPGWVMADDLNVAKDPRLTEKVSVQLKFAPLNEALSAIAKQAKVSLAGSVAMQDLKVNVFAKDQSAGAVLDAIASVLDATWKDDNGVFRLSLSSEAKRRYEKALEADDQAKQANAMKALSSWATTQENRPGSKAMMVRAMQNWSANDWRSLWNGEPAVTVFAPTRPTRRGTAAQRGNRTTMASEVVAVAPTESTVVWYNQSSGKVYTLGSAAYGRPATDSTGGMTLGAGSDSKKLPKEYESWGSPLPAESEALSAPIGAAKLPANPYSNGRWTVSDELEALSKVTKVAVVSDAFRATSRSQTLPGGQTTLEWMNSFASMQNVKVSFANGVLQVRHPEFWLLRRSEVPESLLRPLESNTKLTLEDLGKFAAKLTPWQLGSFQDVRTVAVKFDSEPLVAGNYVLPIYGRMTNSQRNAAFSDQGVSLKQLSSQAGYDAAKAFLVGPMVGALPSGAYQRFNAPMPAVAANQPMGLLLRKADAAAAGGLTAGLRFFIGGSYSDGVAYTVPNPKPLRSAR